MKLSLKKLDTLEIISLISQIKKNGAEPARLISRIKRTSEHMLIDM